MQQPARRDVALGSPSNAVVPQHCCDLIPYLQIYNWLMLAVVKFSLVSNLSDIERIVECVIEGAAGEDYTSALASGRASPCLAANARVFQPFSSFPYTSTLKIREEDITEATASSALTMSFPSTRSYPLGT